MFDDADADADDDDDDDDEEDDDDDDKDDDEIEDDDFVLPFLFDDMYCRYCASFPSQILHRWSLSSSSVIEPSWLSYSTKCNKTPFCDLKPTTPAG